MNRIVPLASPIAASDLANLQDALLLVARGGFFSGNLDERKAIELALKAERANGTFSEGTRSLIRQFQLLRGFNDIGGNVNDETAAALNEVLDSLGALGAGALGGGGGAAAGSPSIPTTPPAQGRIDGRIVFERGNAAEGIELRLFRREFGGAPKPALATVRSLEHGLYSLTYPRKPASRLELVAVDELAQERSIARIDDVDGDATIVLNLVVPDDLRSPVPEFARLTKEVGAQMGDDLSKLAGVQENPRQQDLSALNRATGWDARVLALAAKAVRVNAEIPDLSQQGLYGLFRLGLPTDKVELARLSPEAVELALRASNASGITKLSEDELASFRSRFRTFVHDSALESSPPGSSSSYRSLLEASGASAEGRDRFLPVFAAHRGEPEELWEKAKAAGVSDEDVRRLQTQGKYGLLTKNNAPLIAQMRDVAPEQLPRLGFHEAEKWKETIQALATPARPLDTLIPPAYGGESPQARLQVYADDLAHKVRTSYPTEVFRQLIADPGSDLFQIGTSRAAVSELLDKAAEKGFRLGDVPAGQFLTDHPELLAGRAEEREQLAETVKTLHRVQQMSPGNVAMKVLLGDGLTSATDIASIPRETFLEHYSDLMPPGHAEIVHRKAEQIAAVTYNVFALARELGNAAPLYATAGKAEEREAVRSELIKRYPTMKTLFGSVDYCQCEHCQSVLSPAAYLVDLLQFLDPEPALWNRFLAEWKRTHGEEYTAHHSKPYDELTKRRPDLPHLALTCENTNTVLPYIDLVNEILEYFVAHSALEPQAAHDSGGVATADLLAEPQHVIQEAYEKLAASRQSMKLPFDLWTETVRRFAEAFETPLARVLEVFSPDGAPFAEQAAIFAESLGLSPAEHALFTDGALSTGWPELYGFDAGTGAAAAAGELRSAGRLARVLGVSYAELVEIVRTGFVNPQLDLLVILQKLDVSIEDVTFYEKNRGLLTRPDAELDSEQRAQRQEVEAFEQRLDAVAGARAFVTAALAGNQFDDVLLLAAPAEGCDFDKTRLHFVRDRADEAMGIVFLRINLFVRLWRKLGWTLEETDRALQAFIPAETPFDEAHAAGGPLRSALLSLAHLKTLDERLRPGRNGRLRLLALWMPLATTGRNPLYSQLFLTPAVLKNDPLFDDPLGRYLAFDAEPAPPLKDHLLPLQGALGLTAGEIDEILRDAEISGRTREKPDLTAAEMDAILEAARLAADRATLSLPTVSTLYRYSLLAKALNLSVRDLITLRQLSGDDPFRPVAAGAISDARQDAPLETMRFVERVDRLRDAGLSVEDLDYLLRHRFDADGRYRVDQAAMLALFQTLSDGVRAIRAQYDIPKDPATLSDEAIRQQLGLVLPPAIVSKLMLLLSGTVDLSLEQAQNDAKQFFLDHLAISGNEPQSGFLPFDGAGFLAFLALPPDGSTDEEKQAKQLRLRERKEQLARAFLPYLQERLIRAFVVQTLTAYAAAEPALTEALLTDQRLTGSPDPLLEVFTAAERRGVTMIAPGQELKIQDDVKVAPGTLAGSVQFSGYLEVPSSGPYRFYAALETQDTEVTLHFEHLPTELITGSAQAGNVELEGVTELSAGVPYRFTLDVRNFHGGTARLLVQGDALPKGDLSRLVLYPDSVVHAVAEAMVRLTKTLQLSTALGLNEREVRYLALHPAVAGGAIFGNLPTAPSSVQAVTRFGQLLRLAGYARLKRDLAGGSDDLIPVFEAGERSGEDACTALAKLTRREAAVVLETAELLFGAPRLPDAASVARVWDALQLVQRFGVAPSVIAGWGKILRASDDERFEIAAGLKQALKARFDAESWRQLAQPVFDKLRRRQRDALSDYVMHQLRFETIEQLYEYFLIDPGMEPVVRTSRIRLAISSVQLFIQRCLLNLEAVVHPSAIQSSHWEWMKRYRVWEANRKIFLYPENWLEPEFRDDKTPLFRDLESSLLQGDVSTDLAEDAFFEYVRSLEALARLDIAGVYCDDGAAFANPKVHVVGRTYSEPHKFFYRRQEHGTWTAWEPITAEVEGDQVVPVVWRDRLYVFWVTFVETTRRDASPPDLQPQGRTLAQLFSDTGAAVAMKMVEAHLHWSEYVDGSWSTRESGASGTLVREVPSSYDPRLLGIYVTKDGPDESSNEGGVSIHLSGEHMTGTFHVASRHSVPETGKDVVPARLLYGDVLTGTRQTRETLELTVTFSSQIIESLETDRQTKPRPPQPTPILLEGQSYNVVGCSNAIPRTTAETAALGMPFFYQDSRKHTFFVTPSLTETVTEKGANPVFRPPELEWETPRYWEKPQVDPVFPLRPVGAADRQKFEAVFREPFANADVATPRDWLINKETVLQFDEELIGPAGHAGLSVAALTREGGGAINVDANAAGVGSRDMVIVRDRLAAGSEGLDFRTEPLKIVGAEGLRAALPQRGGGFRNQGGE